MFKGAFNVCRHLHVINDLHTLLEMWMLESRSILTLSFYLVPGCRTMDMSNGLYGAGDLNKRSFALSIGAAIAPVISNPFMTTVAQADPIGNKTAQKLSTITNIKYHESMVISIFPGTLCPLNSDFGKSFWLTIVPCIVMLLMLCYFMFQNSTSTTSNDFEHRRDSSRGSSKDRKVYAFHTLLFIVIFFYRGFYRLAELVFFSYIILSPFEINKVKACLFVMILWAAFAFGHILQQIVTLKVVGSEKQLGIVFFKACVCLIISIALLNAESTNALTINLFVYMLFVSELGPLGQEILLKQGTVSGHMTGKLAMVADALAEALFPAVSLALMYTKGWHAVAFVILAISLFQFLASSALALCQLAIKRDTLSLNYETLSSNKQDDGNRRRIHKEVSRLLGGYTDHEVSYATSDEEVVFDKRRRKEMGNSK